MVRLKKGPPPKRPEKKRPKGRRVTTEKLPEGEENAPKRPRQYRIAQFLAPQQAECADPTDLPERSTENDEETDSRGNLPGIIDDDDAGSSQGSATAHR